MAITNTPVILYSAAGTPIGPAGGIRALLQFYRPTVAADAAGLANIAVPGPASGAGANPVGSPIAVSDLSIEFNSETMTTKGRYGEDNNDPTVMRGKPTLNCGTFIQAAGQAMLAPGDYIDVSIGTTIASTAGAPVFEPISRWVATSNSLATAGNNKWSLKLELDRVNSAATLSLF
jgi:hypothetical protein